MGSHPLSCRVALSVAFGLLGATALIGFYLAIVTWAQGPDHALELLWGDRLFVLLIGAGFGTQIGLFMYVRLLQRVLAGESVALAGAGTATSTVSMVACCAHHLADVLSIVGLSGLAVFLVEFRTPLMLFGLATNALGIAVMLRGLRRMTAGYHVVSLDGAAATERASYDHHDPPVRGRSTRETGISHGR